MVYEKVFFFATLRFSTRIWEKPIYYKERNHSDKAICEGGYMFSQAENLWKKRYFCPSIRTNGWKLRSLIADRNDFVLTYYPIVKETLIYQTVNTAIPCSFNSFTIVSFTWLSVITVLSYSCKFNGTIPCWENFSLSVRIMICSAWGAISRTA